MEDEGARGSAEQKGFDRILALSDGVFAFAITLLVLGLTVPALTSHTSNSSLNLLLALSGELSAFYSYALSFFVISIWWVAHHRLFRYIEKYDPALMWLNTFFLLFVTIIPFLTELLDTYGDIQAAVVIYDLVELFCGIALYAVWRHAARNQLIAKSLSKNQITSIGTRSLVPAFVFLIAIGITFILPSGVAPAYSNFALFAMFPLMRIAGRRLPTKE